MKAFPRLLAAIIFCASLASAHAQGGGMGMGGPGSSGPNFSGSLGKLFGSNSAFTADVEIQSKSPTTGGDIIMPGKISFDQGKSRFEMDVSKTQGTGVPANALAQMKLMGMDIMVMVSLPDKKVILIVYPGLTAYVEMPMDEADASVKLDQFKVENTELAKETVDGHACVKNKTVVTDDKGEKHEFTVWNATDLKSFPIKVIALDKGQESTTLFKDVKLAKPEAKSFEGPATFTKYNDLMTMMMQEGAKKAQRGGGGGK